jgi:hypothetical protein
MSPRGIIEPGNTRSIALGLRLGGVIDADAAGGLATRATW